MDDFIRSKAMLTPAAGGAATTMITGTLASQFGFSAAITALLVSFLLGIIVWADKTVPIAQRVVFYVVNSLTIFTVAMGLNTAGLAASRTMDTESPRTVQERGVQTSSETPFFHEWF